MTLVFFIVVAIMCVLLGFVVLVQNPKGGGLAGTIGGFNNQFMGVKQTTDVLEKGTWLFAALIGVLCLLSTLFISKTSSAGKLNLPTVTTTQQAPAPTPAPAAPATK